MPPLERAEGVAIERVVQQQHVRHHLEPGRDATQAEGDERPEGDVAGHVPRDHVAVLLGRREAHLAQG